MRELFLAALSLALVASVVATSAGLYTKKDHVIILNLSSWKNLMSSPMKVNYLIQYYHSQCGHCQRYSKMFKKFSASVWDWRDTVKVAVIDCLYYSEACVGLHFPTVTVYKSGPPPHKGKNISLAENPKSDPTQLIENLLGQLKDVNYLRPITRAAAEEKPDDTVVLEDREGFMARMVLLDMRHFKKPIFWIPSGTGNYVSVMKVKNRKLEPVEWKLTARWEIVKVVSEFWGVPAPTKPPVSKVANNSLPSYYRKNIQFIDIYSSVRMITLTDVYTAKISSGVKFAALKNFIVLIRDFYADIAKHNKQPMVAEVAGKLTKLFSELVEELNKRTAAASINGTVWKALYESLERKLSLPDISRWSYCVGSNPSMRRYPCGLWTTFHTILRLNYKRGKSAGFTDPIFPLRAIREFVIRFFDCTYCAKHFAAATKGYEDKVKDADGNVSRKEVMLYLWRIHNAVNKRLKKEGSEDPRFPKVQFPSAKRCPACRQDSSPPIHWIMAKTVAFLDSFYDSSKFPIGPRWSTQYSSLGLDRYTPAQTFVTHPLLPGFDFTVCGLVSVVCTTVAILLFLLFYRRRLCCILGRTPRKALGAHMA